MKQREIQQRINMRRNKQTAQKLCSPPPSSTEKKKSGRKTKAEREKEERLTKQKDFLLFLEKNK